MKQIKFPNFVQHALKGAVLESVAEMPAHPVEGRYKNEGLPLHRTR